MIIAITSLVISFFIVISYKFSMSMSKKEKSDWEQVDDIQSFNIKLNKTYDIHCIKRANRVLTRIQREHYLKDNKYIILRGLVEDVLKWDDKSYVICLESKDDDTIYCIFNDNDNLLGLRKGQSLKIKGYLKHNNTTFEIQNCEIVE